MAFKLSYDKKDKHGRIKPGWAAYKHARSITEAKALGATDADLLYDLHASILTVYDDAASLGDRADPPAVTPPTSDGVAVAAVDVEVCAAAVQALGNGYVPTAISEPMASEWSPGAVTALCTHKSRPGAGRRVVAAGGAVSVAAVAAQSAPASVPMKMR